MKSLVVVLMVALALAVPAAAFAQGMPQVSPEVKAGLPNTSGENPDFFNFYGLAPDGVANLTFILAISNLIGGQAITIDTFPFPFTSFTSRTFAFATRETKFFSPPDILCTNTVCEVFIHHPNNTFDFDSLLLIISKATGEIVAIISPFRFVV